MTAPVQLLLEPVVRWPRHAVVGQPYLVEVDLQIAGDPPGWPYDDEEVGLLCLLAGTPGLRVEAVDTPTVVVHRFGGSYGPARYLVTPERTAADVGLVLTVATRRGVPVRTERLPLTVSEAAGGGESTVLTGGGSGRVPERPAPERPAEMPPEPESGSEPRRALVSVRVESDMLNPRRAFVTTELMLDEQRWTVADEPAPVPSAEVMAVGGVHLEEALDRIGAADLLVEFVVPPNLSGIPFERCLALTTGLPTEIGRTYPVVVTVALGGDVVARDRWQATQAMPVVFLDSERPTAALVVRIEMGRPALVAMAAPGDAHPDAAVTALRAGAPGVLWSRQPARLEAFKDLVAAEPEQTFGQWAEAVRRWRSDGWDVALLAREAMLPRAEPFLMFPPAEE
ncbi:VMAP-C domain-containing protein [Paractinoplanes rishiriensis]|uniref:vWA-MoxR associated protein C-terminal domain-containing protein n=1 Tax=Paractinoplanes rishiriensis TaxID=1050105 RepID=A0A919K997_9ACTN|nr:hypothetical protein [Actinoplanes rishiriensis]GIE98936.1 hypothetical protein Ari01nite_64010 [Actinoplanes rishiriensis]